MKARRINLHWPMMQHVLHVERVNNYIDDLQEEASEAALAGNPQRAWYLEHIAMRLPAWVARAQGENQ